MTPEYMLDLADKAARVVLGGQPWHTREDWEDATQEAVLKIWQASQCHGVGEGYLFNAARTGIYEWLRMWKRHPRGGTLLEYLDYVAEQGSSSAPNVSMFRALAPMLRAQRAQKIDEDIVYLELRMAGYSIDGIALEMGLRRRNVYAIRERLLPRLERIARNETVPTRGESVRIGKAAAHRRHA